MIQSMERSYRNFITLSYDKGIEHCLFENRALTGNILTG